MTKQTKTNLLAYAVIGAIATPIAMKDGEVFAALFSVAAVIAFHIFRANRA